MDIGSVKMITIGIDPGVSGAIARWDSHDRLMHVVDMPTFTIKRSGKNVRIVDAVQLHTVLREYAGSCALAIIEQTQAHHGTDQKRGYAQLMDFGFNVGIAYGALCGYAPTEQVTSSVWKRDMKCPAAKDASRHRASQLLPTHAGLWARAMDHNRAEAVLIALYAERIQRQRMAVK